MSTIVRHPIYQQLIRALRDLAAGGEFRSSQQFLTERQISERFEVSRATANKAISSLVAEGLLEFRKGVGTFLRGDSLGYDLRGLVSFTEKARAAGKHPETRVLEFRRLAADDVDATVRQRLDLGPGGEAIYMQRLRLAEHVPVILERRYVSAERCPQLKKSAVGGSLYQFFSGKCGLDVVGADEVIRAVNISASDAKLLKVPRGAAGLLVSRVGHLVNRQPLWWEQTLYRGDAYEFHNHLGSELPARPAIGTLAQTTKGYLA